MKYLRLFENLNQGPRYSVGQKVVALSDSPISNNQLRVKGKVYKISAVYSCGRDYSHY